VRRRENEIRENFFFEKKKLFFSALIWLPLSEASAEREEEDIQNLEEIMRE
jgi:hypothetical protein